MIDVGFFIAQGVSDRYYKQAFLTISGRSTELLLLHSKKREIFSFLGLLYSHLLDSYLPDTGLA